MIISLHNRIKSNRKRIHASKKELAQDAHISFERYKQIEKGKLVPSLEEKYYLAKIFNIDSEMLDCPKDFAPMYVAKEKDRFSSPSLHITRPYQSVETSYTIIDTEDYFSLKGLIPCLIPIIGLSLLMYSIYGLFNFYHQIDFIQGVKVFNAFRHTTALGAFLTCSISFSLLIIFQFIIVINRSMRSNIFSYALVLILTLVGLLSLYANIFLVIQTSTPAQQTVTFPWHFYIVLIILISLSIYSIYSFYKYTKFLHKTNHRIGKSK